jgi:hypothetical protein
VKDSSKILNWEVDWNGVMLESRGPFDVIGAVLSNNVFAVCLMSEWSTVAIN